MERSVTSAIPPFPPPPPPPPGPPYTSGSSGSPGAPGAPVGARWVAGLGAFLLVAAAATFVAVRWDDIPESAKLAALVAITCGCIAAHRRLRSSLPVTAAALLHLGVLLVPIDVAAIGFRVGWAWPEMLLAEGLTATVVFGTAARIEGSVVLRVAAWAGVVALAGGVGGMTALPAGLVLASVAAGAAAGGRWHSWDLDRAASGWAALAGLAVPLAGAEQLAWPAAGVLVDLGLAGEPPHPLAAVTGLVAGLALGIVGQRRRIVPLALLGVACGLVGLTTAFVSLEPSGSFTVAAVAAVCLLAQTAAGLRRSDPFWAQPTEMLANVAEGVAIVITVGLGGVVLLAPFEPSPDPIAGQAAGLVALSWIAAFVRRPAGRARDGWIWTLPAAAVATAAAVTLLTGSGEATAVALTVLGTAALFGPAAGTSIGPPTGRVLAVGLLGWAPIVGYERPALAGALGLAGALALAEAAVRAVRWGAAETGGYGDRPAPVQPTAPIDVLGAGARGHGRGRAVGAPTLLVLAAFVPLGAGALVLAADGHDAAAAIGATCGAWLVALVTGRDDPRGAAPVLDSVVPLSYIPRIAGLVPLAFTPLLQPQHAAVLGGVVAALALVDAVRLDEPLVLVGAGIGGAVAAGALAVAADWTVPEAGLGVTLTGVAWLGVGGTLPRRWTTPAVICAGIAGAAGLALSVTDPAILSTNLLLVGAAVAAVGAAVGRSELMIAGLGVGTVGVWGHLVRADVMTSEPYLAPVAALLLAAGLYGRRARPASPDEHGYGAGTVRAELRPDGRGGASSWVAYAPAVGLLGGAGLLERLAGGPAWHAVVAGSVGIAAVAAGGAWRLAGPLLIGTALVVAITIHETLGVTASLPTWVWLATGGTVLLAAGVAMERRGTGPYETGRRLVDLIHERFA